MNNQEYRRLVEKFQQYFPENNVEPRLFFAPGRVNLIGEHTDYNGGYVLPAALTNGTFMVISPRDDDQFVLRSENFPDEPVEFSVDELDYQVSDGWGNYPKGVISELIQLGTRVHGADIFYHGNIPNGAGLSSSASIGMVTAYGLSSLFDVTLAIEEQAKLCQRMENHFIGVNTGIMDQFAVGFGRKNHAIFLNCRTLDIEEIPLQLGRYRIVITNTNKQRGLSDSKYNERRKECEEGLKRIKRFSPELKDLGELSFEQFSRVEEQIGNPVILKRIRHVVTENERVLQAAGLLKNGDLEAFGKRMNESHESLRDDYEVTGKELDTLYHIQKNLHGCIGTRMTGGGFGGCTVSIVEADSISHFQEKAESYYTKETGLIPSFYVSQIGDGVKEIKEAAIESRRESRQK